MTNSERERFLSTILEVGARMVQCGGEVRRAENTVARLAAAYGFQIPCVYATTTIIESTITAPDGVHYTQARRIDEGGTDLGRLEALNAAARQICTRRPPPEEMEALIRLALSRSQCPWLRCLGYVLAACSFAVFFGGSLRDGIASGVVALAIFQMDLHLQVHTQNQVIYTGVASFLSGCLALALVAAGLGRHADSVMIGDIMLFIPALSIVNGVREMFYRDVMTGMYRLVSAMLTAVAIAAGFGLAILLLGGIA